MDGGAWWAAVYGVAKSRTRLRDFTFTFHFHALEEELATHSSVLAWRIPGMGEPGGLPSMGSHRAGHDWSDLAAAAAAAAAAGISIFFLFLSRMCNIFLPTFPGHSDSKESTCTVGDPGLIPGPARSPGEGNENPLQYSCLENSMDRGACQATVHGVAQSQTRLRD